MNDMKGRLKKVLRAGFVPFIKRLFRNPLTFSVLILLVVVVQNIITTPTFFNMSITNGLLSGYIPNILDEASELVIVTLGMTLVIAASGGPDISVGAIMAVAASFCGLMLNGPEYRTEIFHNPLLLALFVGLCGGALCGAFNGFLVSRLKIQPMIATLILFTAGRSIAKQITYGQTIYIMNPVYKYLGVQIPGIPIRTTILVTIAVIAIVVLLTRLTSLGLYVQSVGINGSASRLVGLNSRVIKFMAFVICGVLAGVAGLVGSSSVGSVNSGEIGYGSGDGCHTGCGARRQYARRGEVFHCRLCDRSIHNTGNNHIALCYECTRRPAKRIQSCDNYHNNCCKQRCV